VVASCGHQIAFAPDVALDLIGIALENRMTLMPVIQILALSMLVWYTKNGRKEKPM
jgi:hypothetical protein